MHDTTSDRTEQRINTVADGITRGTVCAHRPTDGWVLCTDVGEAVLDSTDGDEAEEYVKFVLLEHSDDVDHVTDEEFQEWLEPATTLDDRREAAGHLAEEHDVYVALASKFKALGPIHLDYRHTKPLGEVV
jgi:hypothetical protein